MILDNELIFSDKQAITASAVSTNVLDFTGDGQPYEQNFLVVRVVENFTDTGNDSTLTVTLQTDSTDSMSSPKIMYTTGAIAYADIPKVGEASLINMRLPYGLERYVRLSYTVGNGNFATGKIDAYITMATEI